MEDVPTAPGEETDWQTKFNRILDSNRFAAVVVVWPRWAKMQATWDELLLLRERKRSQELPGIYALVDERAARIRGGELAILEAGDRSCYLRGLHHLQITAIPFRGSRSFQHAIDALVDELAP